MDLPQPLSPASPENLAAHQLKADIGDRVNGTTRGIVIDAEMFGFKEYIALRCHLCHRFLCYLCLRLTAQARVSDLVDAEVDEG